MRTIVAIIMIAVLGLLSGCTFPSRYERDPSGVGFGRDDMKKSRCACDIFYQDGKYL